MDFSTKSQFQYPFHKTSCDDQTDPKIITIKKKKKYIVRVKIIKFFKTNKLFGLYKYHKTCIISVTKRYEKKLYYYIC